MNNPSLAPFHSGEIQSSSLSHMLYEHPAHPDKLFRQNMELAQETEDPVVATVEGLRKSRELFEDIEQNYGVQHVSFLPVVGELPDGEVGAYIISEKIEGHAYAPELGVSKGEYLASLSLLPEHKNAGKTLVSQLSGYWVDKTSGNLPMLSDIFSVDQYVYREESDSFVLVDMDPYYITEPDADNWVVEYTAEQLQRFAEMVFDTDELQEWHKTITNRPSLSLLIPA